MVLPTDERAVPPDDPRSSERMIRECLPVAPGGFVPLRGEGPFNEAGTALAKHIAALGPLDAVVLGMGTDTHIASLFPRDRRLEQAAWEGTPAVLAAYPSNLEPRLSLAPLILTRARWKALLIAGQDKLTSLTRALGSADPVTYPVRLLFEDGSSPRIYCAE
jgi:6-phosphogluconolactonase